jgi:tripartite-type tricarboxylate transporter receptor subunit TctC
VPPISSWLPGFEAISWGGIAAPAATPAETLQRLADTLLAAGQAEKLRQRLVELGVTLRVEGPDAMRAFVATEIARWREVVQATGMTAE